GPAATRAMASCTRAVGGLASGLREIPQPLGRASGTPFPAYGSAAPVARATALVYGAAAAVRSSTRFSCRSLPLQATHRQRGAGPAPDGSGPVLQAGCPANPRSRRLPGAPTPRSTEVPRNAPQDDLAARSRNLGVGARAARARADGGRDPRQALRGHGRPR